MADGERRVSEPINVHVVADHHVGSDVETADALDTDVVADGCPVFDDQITAQDTDVVPDRDVRAEADAVRFDSQAPPGAKISRPPGAERRPVKPRPAPPSPVTEPAKKGDENSQHP